MSEIMIRNAIEPVILDVTLNDIRRELDYLEERELVAVSHRDYPGVAGQNQQPRHRYRGIYGGLPPRHRPSQKVVVRCRADRR
jgi:hypothetical protein